MKSEHETGSPHRLNGICIRRMFSLIANEETQQFFKQNGLMLHCSEYEDVSLLTKWVASRWVVDSNPTEVFVAQISYFALKMSQIGVEAFRGKTER